MLICLNILDTNTGMMSSIRLDRENIKYHPEDGKVILTYDDIINIAEWPEGPMLELTQGELFVVPSPSIKHQIISQRLNNIIYNFATDNSLGVVLTAPVDVKLSDENVVIPDILFVKSKSEGGAKIEESHVNGTPDLIFEILSSNKKRDLIEKKEIYQQFRVKEYVIVDPVDKIFTLYRLGNEGTYTKTQYTDDETLTLSTLNSLEIEIKPIFEDI